MLENLVGHWTLQRRVVLTSGSLMATMKGTASIALPVEGACQYSEEGTIKMADSNHPLIVFTRRYIYRDEQGTLAIYFDEKPMRLFQNIAFKAVGKTFEGSATHYCSPDTYTSHYQFLRPDSFNIKHHIEGPRKAYTIFTVYERLCPFNP